MRHDPISFVVGVQTEPRDDGSVSTRYLIRCAYCQDTHWLWRLPHHIPAPCNPHGGYFIDPLPLALRKDTPDDHEWSQPDAAARRRAYIEACRTAGRDTALHEDRDGAAVARRPRP